MSETKQTTGFKLPKIDIKHKFYEVITPTNGKKVKVKGLSNSDLLVLTNSSVTDTASKLNVAINLLYSAIADKSPFNNDFEYFVTHCDYDNDFMALVVGAIAETYGENEKLKFSINCTSCGSDVHFIVPYSRIVTDLKVNESGDCSFYEKYEWHDFQEYGVSLYLKSPSIQSHIGSVSVVEQLVDRIEKIMSVLEIPEIKRDPLLITAAYCKYVRGIKSLETNEELIVDFESDEINDEFFTKLVYMSNLLGEFNSDDLAKIPHLVESSKYYLKCTHKRTCKKCGTENSVDLKPSLQELITP